MHENEIAAKIVDAALKVHTQLGPGLLESVYETILAYELERRGLFVQRQVNIGIVYEELRFETGFRADLVVEGRVLVELKPVERTSSVHRRQLITYVRLANLGLGLRLDSFVSDFGRGQGSSTILVQRSDACFGTNAPTLDSVHATFDHVVLVPPAPRELCVGGFPGEHAPARGVGGA